ncbi:MAG: hypothetical protein C4558_07480 [Dehalococcoidia bacterium]|nr:MAG: hypothetical protein C4558_07480 [Dehalococcoidia bacterium]
MGLELWIPPSARPKYKCETCQKPFYEGEERAWAAHCKRCFEDHKDAFDAEHQGLRDFDSMQGKADIEYEDWVKRHGRVR